VIHARVGSRTGPVGERRVGINNILILGIVAILAISIVPMTASPAVVDDTFVGSFNASPSLINLNRETLVEVEIIQTHGDGLDNYQVTVVAPDGTEASAWFNFTALGILNLTLGDPSSGFMTAVDQVGTYDLKLEHHDGANYTLAGVEQVEVTDKLDIHLETRIASNEYTDAHSCPVSTDFQRGAEFVGMAFIYYASTGEPVTPDSSPNAAGNIFGTILGETLDLPFMSYAQNWHWVWFFPWDAPVGPAEFNVSASDGMGNTGTAVTGIEWNTAVNIGPAILTVTPQILNESGVESISYEQGETLTVEVNVLYEGHNAHNAEFEGPLTPDRDGKVIAHLGWGEFNATSSMYNETLTNLTLSYDSDTKNWVADYRIPEATANITNLQAVIIATDGADEVPNSGSAFTTMVRIQAPPPLPPPPPPPPEVEETDEGFSSAVVGGLAMVAMLAGLGVGIVIARRS